MSSKTKKRQKYSRQQITIDMFGTGNSDKMNSNASFSSNSNGNVQVTNYWRKPDPVEVVPIPINNRKNEKKKNKEKIVIENATTAETQEGDNLIGLMNENLAIDTSSDDRNFRIIRMISG